MAGTAKRRRWIGVTPSASPSWAATAASTCPGLGSQPARGSSGHVPVHNDPGTAYLQFSPAEELRRTSEVIMQNMQALQGA